MKPKSPSWARVSCMVLTSPVMALMMSTGMVLVFMVTPISVSAKLPVSGTSRP